MTENAKTTSVVSRRRLLTTLASGGVAAGAMAIPTKWARPVVDSVVLPAHARSSPGCVGQGGQTLTLNGNLAPDQQDPFSFCISGAGPNDTVQIDLICSDGTLDPVLEVTNPDGVDYFDDDSGAPCDAFNSSQIGPIPAVNGLWTGIARGFAGDSGPYTLIVTVSGSAML